MKQKRAHPEDFTEEEKKEANQKALDALTPDEKDFLESKGLVSWYLAHNFNPTLPVNKSPLATMGAILNDNCIITVEDYGRETLYGFVFEWVKDNLEDGVRVWILTKFKSWCLVANQNSLLGAKEAINSQFDYPLVKYLSEIEEITKDNLKNHFPEMVSIPLEALEKYESSWDKLPK